MVSENGQVLIEIPPTDQPVVYATQKDFTVCGAKIKVQIQRGTGFCSQRCEKLFKGEVPKERALSP
jgi:predicted nucleic acid-binding Zn ribbon protein